MEEMNDSEWSADDRRDAPAPDRETTPVLVHLADVHDLRVADGSPDVRGWDVCTAAGEKVGTVKDLIVDTRLMKVRYIEARIDRETLNSSGDRYVLIPIGSARLDDAKDHVYLDAAVVDPRSLPPYDRSPLSREYEQYLQDRFPRALTADRAPGADDDPALDAPTLPAGSGDDFYADVRFDDGRFLGGRKDRDGASYLAPRKNESRDPTSGGDDMRQPPDPS